MKRFLSNQTPRLLQALLLFTLCLHLSACPPGDASEEDEADAGDTAPIIIPVEVHKVTRGDIVQTLQSSATVTAQQNVHLIAEASGQISSVLVEEGDKVHAGQLLARITNHQLEQSIGGSEITVSRLRKEREDLKPLLDKGYTSRKSYEEIEYQLKQAQQQLRAARGQLKALRVTAPFDGIVAQRSVQQGQQVNLGTELFHLVNPDKLEVVINIPERSLGKIQEDGEGYITSEALNTKHHFPARVRLINPVVDPRTGTIKVTLTILKPQLKDQDRTLKLRPGMLIQSHLITARQKNVILIPKRALIREESHAYVFVTVTSPDGYIASKREVTPGLSQDNMLEVLKGLQPDEEIVVLGQTGLKEGSKLKLVAP